LTDSVSHVIVLFMARQIPKVRFEQLIECATRVFIECGYRRTQMADVAEAMGIAKGTLYAYVESKEALFDLVARCVDREDWRTAPPEFPVATPKPKATLRYVQARLAQTQSVPALADALNRKRVRDAAAELAAIVAGLYDLLATNRNGITLIDRSSRDYPDLAALWIEARSGLLTLLEDYLRSRIVAGHLHPVPDTKAAARYILESATFWAVHRHWDLRTETASESVAKETVVQFITLSLTSTPACSHPSNTKGSL
jgi:AcrR family transcriptional regulator